MKDRIRCVMDYAGLTQTEFSARLSIPPSSLSSIYTGRTKPTNNHVQAIHQAFPEINISWLMFGEGEMLIPKKDEQASADVSDLVSEGVADLGLFTQQSDVTPLPIEVSSSGSIHPRTDRNVSGRAALSPHTDIGSNRDTLRQNRPPQNAIENTKNVDIKRRKIKEIRIFFDDGTYEVFGPTSK